MRQVNKIRVHTKIKTKFLLRIAYGSPIPAKFHGVRLGSLDAENIVTPKSDQQKTGGSFGFISEKHVDASIRPSIGR